MAKYRVSYTELVYKNCIVEADSVEEAEEIVRNEDYDNMSDIDETSSDIDEINSVELEED